MQKFLSYLLQPGNLLALLFLVAFALCGVFLWQEGGNWIMIVGFALVALFLYKSWKR